MTARKDNKGRNLRTGEYYNPKTHIYQFRKMIDGRRVTISDFDLMELRKRENELLVDLDKGKVMNNRSGNMTLNDYFDFWFSTYAPNKIKASTRSMYNGSYNVHVRDSLGKKKLGSITKVDCQIFFNDLIAAGKKHGTLNTLKSILCDLFNCALDEDIIFRNPVIKIDIGKKDTPEKPIVSEEPLKQFLSYAEKHYPDDYAMFVTLFNTGMRIGELGALTWNDIDFANSTISITKTIKGLDKSLYNMKIAIGTPKSKKSNRVIPMNEQTKKVLLQHRMKHFHKSDYSVPFINDRGEIIGECRDFVFVTEKRKTIIDAQAAKAKIKKIVNHYNESAGKNSTKLKMFTPHSTRHTFATRAFEAGADMKLVSETLGHSSIVITYDTYTHSGDKNQELKQDLMKSVSVI